MISRLLFKPARQGVCRSFVAFGGWRSPIYMCTGSSDADTAIECLSEVLTWAMLVWLARRKKLKQIVRDGLVVFLCRRGGSTSWQGPSNLALPLFWWTDLSVLMDVSCNVIDSTVQVYLTYFGFMTCHAELGKSPKSNTTMCKISPRRLLVGFFVSRCNRIECQNACLMIHFRPTGCKSNQTKKVNDRLS